jgi:tRNA nucleotidyltransferase (CCA-adding enzyme)
MSAFIVGGMVRDILLEYPSTDLDVTVEGDAVKVARDYARSVGGSVRGVTRFGTCKVEGGPAGVVDFAATRTETYPRPGALPDVKKCPDIILDLERRDFAVNAMAVSLSTGSYGLLIDPFDGLGDIERRQLAVLHPESFQDDPTRILRGVRFAARYGYGFEKHTLGFLRQCVAKGCMQTISGKRVRRELELVFCEEKVVKAIRLLEKHAFLRTIAKSLSFGAGKVKRLAAVDRVARRFCGWAESEEFDFATYWFGYLFAGQKSAAERLAGYLNLDRKSRSVCHWAALEMDAAYRDLSGLKPSSPHGVRGLLNALPLESLALLYAFSGRRERGLIERFVTDWRHVEPVLTGADIVKLGIRQGPAVGRMLDKILELKLLGRLPTRRSEVAFVKREAGVRS